jgi:hypothetical protein
MDRRVKSLLVVGIGVAVVAVVLSLASSEARAENLMADPSFENPGPRTRWGTVFPDWLGNIYETPGQFEVGQIARTGKTSCEIIADGGKIRMQSKPMTLEPGRYKLVAWLRGLDLAEGAYRYAIDLSAFNPAKYDSLRKDGKPLVGTFGWTPVTYVFDVPAGAKPGQFVCGLCLTRGILWIDDVSLEKVGPEVELTPTPVVGSEEKPIAPPGDLGANPVRCPQCGYRNNPAWGKCYACGAELKTAAAKKLEGPPVKVFADFEDGKTAPFAGGAIETEKPITGKGSLRVDKGYVTMDGQFDWSQYDYIVFDVMNPNPDPVIMAVEMRDDQTRDYWTRLNLETMAPPGRSTVTIPTVNYVGEKSRPGRMLIRDKITRFVASAGEKGPALIFDNFRLERLDTSTVKFTELVAFDFGTIDSPVMEGFDPVTSGTAYSAGRGYGWDHADIWRSFNVLQPEALTQDFICVRAGKFRVDVPNGTYHGMILIDSPNGFWGEVPMYRDRRVIVNARPVVDDRMDYGKFKAWYFRNASREDLPGVDAFAQYIQTMIPERRFDVDVTDGKLEFEFKGDGWAISLSALVLYPDAKKAQGEKFLSWVTERRKKQFNDYFKQMELAPAGAAAPKNGYVLFTRGFTTLPGAYDGPREGEVLGKEGLGLKMATGEEAALVFSVQPSGDLGPVDIEVSDFKSANGQMLPKGTLRPGWLDYRITRVTADGSVFTVKPRYWHATPAPAAPKVTRTFWVRAKLPQAVEGMAAAGNAPAVKGDFTGTITVKPKNGPPTVIPVKVTVLPFAIDPITDVPAGPWGSGIDLPWFGNDPETQNWQWTMFEKALDVLKDAGCTSFSARPTGLSFTAKGGQITLKTDQADREMELIRAKGFTQMISSYGAGLGGYNLYQGLSEDQAKAAGFADAAAMMKAIWKAIDDHAVEKNWVPVAWNLCDEPLGDAIAASVKCALQHREAGVGLKRTTFMGATSMEGNDPKNPHYELVKALPVPSLNGHDDASVKLLREAGNKFSFYNGGNRWTFGRYMKALVVNDGLALRVTWHYNAAAGDPYYALDCREDDYCWFNTNPAGELVPSIGFLGDVQPGLNDYRYLSTLGRLVKEKPNHPAAAQAKAVYDEMVNLVAGKDRNGRGYRKLESGQTEFDADRAKVTAAIEAMLK